MIDELELENSIPFNTTFFKSDINNNELLRLLWNVVYPDKKFRKDSKQLNHLKVIVLKLYDCHNSGYDYIGFSRNNNDYNLDNNSNVLQLSYRVTIHIIDQLYEDGYIHHHLGYYDNINETGKFSRMRATDKLISLIESVEEGIIDIDTDEVPDCYTDLIVLKDHKKKIIDYVETDLTAEWRAVLVNYNKLIAKSKISLNINTDVKVNYDRKFVRRVFNDSSFTLGGRFYGGWWQNIKSKYRTNILIDDKETTEIDYTALHPILAYTLKGIDYNNAFGDDPYDIKGIEPFDGLRKLLKHVILICINSADRVGALRALNKKANFGDIVKHPKHSMSYLINACDKHHKYISEYFFTDMGKLLQYNDSMVAHNIIKHFTDKGILVLCIHDSFICQKEFEEELYGYMDECITNAYGTDIDMKFK